MGIKTFRPTTPSNRFKQLPTFEELTTRRPHRALTQAKRKTGGRNNSGRISVRHIGGGHKRRYRIVSFDKTHELSGVVVHIEYDPNRSSRIALIKSVSGEHSYILAPKGLRQGDQVASGSKAEPTVGNSLPLSKVPLGSHIHNLSIFPGQPGKLARAAGQYATLMSKEGIYCIVRLPSGEARRFHSDCYCTIGEVGNEDHINIKSGKAGRSRWLGIRPTVRGMAMNPIDHPMGGGQGKSKGGGGRQHPMSPWGQLAKSFITRKRNKTSNRFIVTRRNGKKVKLK